MFEEIDGEEACDSRDGDDPTRRSKGDLVSFERFLGDLFFLNFGSENSREDGDSRDEGDGVLGKNMLAVVVVALVIGDVGEVIGEAIGEVIGEVIEEGIEGAGVIIVCLVTAAEGWREEIGEEEEKEEWEEVWEEEEEEDKEDEEDEDEENEEEEEEDEENEEENGSTC